MSSPLFSIGGIASGLPPDLVDQLMAVERLPVQRLENRQSLIEVRGDAWKQINTRLSALRSAVDAVRRPTSFSALSTVTSSNDAAVKVTRSGSPADGSLTFTVNRLASTMQRSVDDRFTGLDASLDGRTLSITAGGQTVDVTPAAPDATLQDLVDTINRSELGVRASTLQVTSGSYRLVLTAATTGAEAAFTAAGSGWADETSGAALDWSLDADSLIAEAANARLTVGTGASAIVIERATNAITDLYDGMTIDLKAPTTDTVTIGASRDIDGAVKAVKTVVDKMNDTISALTELSKYDPATKKAGPLQGDATVRGLLRDLRGALSATVDSAAGAFGYAGGVGVSLTREGTFKLDETRLRSALSADFAATASLFTRNGVSSNPDVVYLSSNASTAAGELTVAVTKRATVTNITGAVAVPPASDQVYRITTASGPVVVTLPVDAPVSQAIVEINSALAAGGSTAMAVDDAGAVSLVETVAGSGRAIKVERQEADGTWTQTGHGDGQDAAADITRDGATTSHEGQGDRLAIDDGALRGLRLLLDGPVGATAQVRLSQGIGGMLDAALSRAEGVDGSIKRAQNLADSHIGLLREQIERYEIRLELREAALRQKFSAMESAMASLASQGNWLSAQLPGLQANSSATNR